MKRIPYFLVGLIWVCFCGYQAQAGGNDTNAPRIGIYDSRAVAYAHFWSAPYQKQLQESVAAAKAAQAAGDTNKFQQLSAALRAVQDASDRQVFSTAPVDDALAAIEANIPKIKQELGVTALVSKWDEKTLKLHPEASQVDVTDRLVHEFIQPTEKQAKTLLQLQKSKPVSLQKADDLHRQGKP